MGANLMRRTGFDRVLYALIRALLWMLFKVFFRIEAVGRAHVPTRGGCLLASNHASYLDPPLIAVAAGRQLRFLARDTLYRNKFFAWLIFRLGAIPMDRTRGDVAALRSALKITGAGQALVLFPEGTRTLDGNLQEAKPGIGFLVAKAKVPVVPVYVDGSYRAYPKGAKRMQRTKIRVRFGAPITPEELAALGKGKAAYLEMAGLTMARIAALAETARAARR